MAIDFRTLIGVVFDNNQAQKELDRQIKSLQKNSKLALDIKLSDKDAKKIIQDQSKMWSNYRKEAVSAIGASNTELKKMAQYYKQLDKDIVSQNKLADSMTIVKNRAEAASKSFNSYTQTLKPNALTQYSTEIRKISDAFTQAGNSGKQIDLSKANSQLSKFKSEMKNAGMETASFTQILKNNLSAFTNWYFIGNAVSSVVRDFKAAIVTIKDVDTLLTEISKTSNLTGESLKQLGIDAFDAASKYGATVQDYLSGYLEMSRGTDEATAKGLAGLSILAQSAGDMTAELANGYIVATNAAYGLNNEVSKLNDILDGQNQITNRNQVSMSDLAEATKVAGSQASQAGVAIDKMTAATGTMIASTKQGGEIAGRSYKAILMNLQQVSGEIDGEIFNEESFKKAEKALYDVGVATEELVNGTAKLRDPMLILEELAEVYNSLPSDSVEKANIITGLGGKHYGNQLAALLSNWKTYEKMLSDYQNANGSALAEAQKTADSIEGRLNKMTNTWDEAVANVVDSDMLKAFISIGTGAIELTDDLDLLQTTLIGLGGLGAYKALTSLVPMFKNAISSTIAFGNALNMVKANDFVADTNNLSKAITGLTLSQATAVLSTKTLDVATIEATMTQAGFSVAEAKTTASTLAMSSAQTVATSTTVGFGASIKALTAAMAANPVGLIITGITVAVSALSFGLSKYKQAQEEALAKAKENAENAKSLTDEITDLTIKYNELAEAVKTDASAKNDLLITQNELLTKLGLEGQSIDSLIDKYGSLSEAIKQATLDQLENAETDLTSIYSKNEKSLLGYGKGSGFGGNVVQDNQVKGFDILKNSGLLDYGDMGFTMGDVDTSSTEGILDFYQKIQDAMDELKASGKYTTAELVNDPVWSMLNSRYEELKPYVDDYKNSVSDLNTNLVRQQMLMALQGKELPTTKSEFDSFKKSLVDSAVASGEFIGSQEQITASVENFLATQSQFAGFMGVIDNTNTSLDTSAEKVISLSDALSTLSKDNKLMSSVNDDIKELGTISTETLKNIIDTYPELESAVQDFLAGKKSEKELIESMQSAYKTDYDAYRLAVLDKQAIDSTFYSSILTNMDDSIIQLASKYGIDLQNFANYQASKIALNAEFQKSLEESQKTQTFNDMFTAPSLGTNWTTGIETDIENKANQKASDFQTIIDGMNSVVDSYIKGFVDSPSSGKGSGNDKVELPEKYTSERADLEHRRNMGLSDKDYFNELKGLETTYLKGHKEYQSEIWSIDESIYKHNQELADKAKQDAENDIKSKFDALDHAYAMGDIKSEVDYQKARWELAKEYYWKNAEYAEEWKKAQEEWHKYNVELAEEELEEKKKLLEEEEKLRVDTINSIIDKYSELRDAIMKTAEGQTGDAQIETYSEGIKSANKEIKYLNSEIDKLNKKEINDTFTLDDYNSQLSNLQSALSEAYSSIDDFNKAISESVKSNQDEVFDVLEDQYDKMSEYWEKERDAYSDIVKAQKEILQLKKEQNDYEKSIADKTKEISKIENRMAELQKAASTGDRQAQAELSKLDEERTEKREDLAEAQSDHEYDLANDALDKALEDNEKIVDAKLEALKTEYETQKANQEELYRQLIDLTSKASTYTVEAYSQAIDEIAAKFSQSGINLSEDYLGGLKTAQAQNGNNANAVTSILGSKSDANKKQNVSDLSGLNKFLAEQGYKTINKETMVKLAQALGLSNIDSVDDVGTDDIGRINKNLILQELKKILGGSTFSTGGIAKSMGEDGWGLIEKEELILNKGGSKIYTQQLAPLMKDFVTKFNLVKPNIPAITPRSTSPTINFNLNGGTITPDAVSQFNKWKVDITNDITKTILDASRQHR